MNAVPASGLIPAEPGVRAGKSITVFHNIDFVAVFGYGPVGRQVTVRVLRDGVTIGSATGPTVSTPEGPALEVNHGPEGAPLPGDCWSGHTPDIRPGDHIVVTDGAGRDRVIVDDIRFTGDPSEELLSGDILVPFTAIDAAGTPIPVARIDSAEFRAGSRLRFESTDIVVEPAAGGEPGAYQMRYQSPFAPSRNRDALGQDQMRALLLGDGHAIGFGHVAPPPLEAMLVDGLADTPGPAPGCEAAPSGTEGVTSVTPTLINTRTPATATLRVQGMSEDATEVEVQLRDSNSVRTAPATLSAETGLQTWRASFPVADLTALSGNVRVTALIDGVASTVTKTLVRDTVRPDAPRASLASGIYRGPQRVSLSAGGGERIRYTLGDGSQAAPTLTRGRLYSGGQLLIRRTRVLKVVAIDRANNVSPVARFRYRIR
ncbi:MAG: chitobiase/beta-hexosaminidase C-terminal domain-containing protein [Actinomycetota bacterium]|nr:chitobiase/beta-hexosaminidase C-terminal domain-containing protein [Actinomycetota bacterium]